MSPHALKHSTKTTKYQIINQRIYMVYYREQSMEQEENNHNTSPTVKVNDGTETNTTIN